MFDALAEWMGHPLYFGMHEGESPRRTALAHAIIAPYDAYPTADGPLVLLSVQNDREWRRLAEQVLERPDLADDPDFATNMARTENRARTDQAVAKTLGQLTASEAVRRLEEAGIACARLNEVAELARHPQLSARDRWREVDSPVGPLRTLLPPIGLPGGHPPRMGAVPGLGEHTDALLRALGMGDARIAALRRDGVIA
jgi:itaconate CoA-transferase